MGPSAYAFFLKFPLVILLEKTEYLKVTLENVRASGPGHGKSQTEFMDQESNSLCR